jgi:hypothetical protein
LFLSQLVTLKNIRLDVVHGGTTTRGNPVRTTETEPVLWTRSGIL